MQNALETFYYEIAEIPKDRVKAVQRSINRMLELVMPRLRRNRFAFRFGNPILSDPLFENLKTISVDSVELVIPMILPRPFWEPHPTIAGYVRLPLPEIKKDTLLAENPWRHFKSKDGLYLSPLQVTVVTWALVRDTLVLPWPVKAYEMLPLRLKHEGCVLLLKDTEIDLTVKIIIGLKFDEKDPCNLYTKPFEDDIDTRSDEYWRLTFIENELKILKVIEPADRFRRAQAVKTLCALTKLDPIYRALNDYQILTVMFNITDEELHDKTWHKKSLKECFYLLLNKLLFFLKQGNLPHFYISNLNLFRTMEIRDKKLLIGRVSFMSVNEKEVIRVCRRRALSYKASLLPPIETLIEEYDSAPKGTDLFYEATDDHLGEEFKVDYYAK
jgi:hypothetical protein